VVHMANLVVGGVGGDVDRVILTHTVHGDGVRVRCIGGETIICWHYGAARL
jgi:hypothetical protein